MKLPSDNLETDLRQALAAIAQQPLPEFLLQKGILRSLGSDLLRQRLCESVVFSSEEQPLVISRLFQGIAIDPPTALSPGWLEGLPPMLQGPLRERWDQIRLQKWMEVAYRERVEPYFLERRSDLEQVVYGMIRLRHQGVAEELYLRMLDDQADFGELAKQYSLGEERFTRGLVGPIQISQPHPTIRAVLQQLAVGDLHPPFSVENWVLLVRMEHRQPAQLTDSLMLQLCQELLQQDLDACLDEQLQALYPALVESYPPLLVAATVVPVTSQPVPTAVVPEPAPAAAIVPDLPPTSPASPPAVPQSPAARPEPRAAEPTPASSPQQSQSPADTVAPAVQQQPVPSAPAAPPVPLAAPPPPQLPDVPLPPALRPAPAAAELVHDGSPALVPPPPPASPPHVSAVDQGQEIALEPEPSAAAALGQAFASEPPLPALPAVTPPPPVHRPVLAGEALEAAESLPASSADRPSSPSEPDRSEAPIDASIDPAGGAAADLPSRAEAEPESSDAVAASPVRPDAAAAGPAAALDLSAAPPDQRPAPPAVSEPPLTAPSGRPERVAATLPAPAPAPAPASGPEPLAARPTRSAGSAARPLSPQPGEPGASPADVAGFSSAPQDSAEVDSITGLSIAPASVDPVVVSFPLPASPMPPMAPLAPASPQPEPRGGGSAPGAAAPARLTIQDIPLPLLSEVVSGLDASGASTPPGTVLSHSGLARPLPSDWRAISRRLPRAVPSAPCILSPILSERPPGEPGSAVRSRDEAPP